jgi:hypothetical protein
MKPTLASAEVMSKVTVCLSTAWEFLSGERRSFEPVADPVTPPHAEFSYLLPLKARASNSVGGVGVFIQTADARVVAANMFGELPHEVQVSNLGDACAEACNVLAECVLLNVTNHVNVTMGLPFRADDFVYKEICQKGAVAACYRCSTEDGHLYVVAYGPARESELSKFANLSP